MHSLYYQPEGTWFGDCMPYAENGVFYLYHQRDTRKPGPFGEPFGWALATTRDFVDYDDRGESLHRGGDDEQDQFIFAGSVFKARDGRYYALYTGYNRDYPAQGKASQVLMIAASDDLVTWEKTDTRLVPPQEGYDPDDWRDPFVLWNEEAGEYLMILGGRKKGPKVLTGSTVAFTSTDLENWEFQGDFWDPGLYSMHEMPDLFRMGDYWYLLTTEYSDKSKTVYRMSTSLDGPWTAPVDDAFDGRAYYAARSAADGGRRYLFGWVPTKENDDDLASWEWGGTLVVHELVQRADGSLAAAIPQGVADAFGEAESLGSDPLELASIDGLAEQVLTPDSGTLFLFGTTFTVAPGTRALSLRLYEDSVTGAGYEFVVTPGENRLFFDRRPNYPWHQYANKGLDRPIVLDPEVPHRLEVVVDDTIATLYVDGVALNARLNTKPGSALTLGVVEGSAVFTDTSIRRSLKERR
ncbi:glycosyl hydrolase family 32 [Herbiconiux moechotypicola]|uniref:beta-fructofuranosidase n=1 Tax=Herbiconiux moechotypicola TaxID=637393 RepID=A0ABN3DPP2_9MICO|nr:glycosyl hydrolase family 32 [Herbiconiux moechotypicola]MCS5731706.1 glycosyl hydrolase family 32 [Herbiconiux moechotypicola]